MCLTNIIFFSCHKKPAILFTALSSSETNIHFANNLHEHDSLNIFDYLYYYNGGGVAIGDINNDGLPDIYFTANSKGNNKLYLNKGNFKFEDITAKAGVQGISDWCTGVTMADVNGDGLLDIYVCSVNNKLGLKGHNQLFINNGNLTFTDSASSYGLDFSGYSTQAVFFDYDHDGDLDCYLLNQSDHPNEKYGDTSLRGKSNPFSGDRLFRNDISTIGKFTNVTHEAGIISGDIGYGLGVAAGDLNNDGWEDIYISNDFFENDFYYINNHDGTFTESGNKHFSHYSKFSMGNDIADYNNDGQLDIVTLDMLPGEEKILKTYGSDVQPDIYNTTLTSNGFQNQYSRNCLQRNMGNGVKFSDVALMNGVAATDWSWCPLFADFDNDGIKDLFISNGIVKRMSDLDYIKFNSSPQVQMQINKTRSFDSTILNNIPFGKMHNYIFKGNKDEHFTDISTAWGFSKPVFSNGAAYADLNNDGKLDLVINNINEPASVYKNVSASKNYLTVKCKGNNSNTQGIGCKVYIFSKGNLQYQQLMLTRGFQSSSDSRLHFGIDTVKSIDSLFIVWPDQSCQLLKNVKVNQQILLEEKNANGVFNYYSFFPSPDNNIVTDVTDTINLNWKHKEDYFNDFSQQYLIPHELSTKGPKVAVADVNGDGLDDFYMCGARYQPGALFIQTKKGGFMQADTSVFNADALCEDVNAIFFDADNDGDKDLYVCSGGNEITGTVPQLLDRLYLNDGKGNFKKVTSALPALYNNKSTVVAADIDHDGDSDLFVGISADASAYGLPQASYLLLNDGKAHFAAAGKSIIDLTNIGMVTSAQFADLNNDGWADLIIAGEWMPVVIFINNHGMFKKQKNSLSPGLWQSLYVTDINGDGFPDIVAGNYGLNSKLKAPLKLYVKDIDGNGTIDQLLTITDNGNEYTLLGKDELEKQLPFIKKDYLQYSAFASKSFNEVWDKYVSNAPVLKADYLASCALINDGKGNFKEQSLPAMLQYTPLFAFISSKLNNKNILLSGGNFYGVLPYEGRYDALPLSFCYADKNGTTQSKFLPESLLKLKGEVRDLKMLYTSKGNILIVARNNDSPVFLKLY